MASIIFLFSVAGIYCSAEEIGSRLMPNTVNAVDLAIQTTSCNNDTDCLIPDYNVQLVPSTSPTLSAKIQIIMDDTGYHLDILPGSARRRVKREATKFATQFINGLCLVQNGRPDGARVEFLNTKYDLESGQSYSRLIMAHMSSYDRDSYTFTLQTTVECLKSRP